MRMECLISLGIMVGILSIGSAADIHAAGKELSIQIVTQPTASSIETQKKFSIQTEAHAMCLGNVFSESNPNVAAKLTPKNVDREGKVTWVWPIDSKRLHGRWIVQIQCATSTSKGRLREAIEFP